MLKQPSSNLGQYKEDAVPATGAKAEEADGQGASAANSRLA